MTQDIYTADLLEQDNDTMLNSVMWRLAVAARLVARGSGGVDIDPNYLMHEVETQLNLFHTANVTREALE